MPMRHILGRNIRRIADLLDPPLPTKPRTVWEPPPDALLHTGAIGVERLFTPRREVKLDREVLDEAGLRQLARERRAAFYEALKDTP